MRTKLIAVVLASAVAACSTPGTVPADRGVSSVHEPVLSRATFAIDLAAPDGTLPPEEVARLDAWFQSLGLAFGDSIFVDGAYSDAARAQVADIAGRYGVMVLPAAPVTAGVVPAGTVRVVVARNRAEVPGCPNWSRPQQPNWENRTMSNFGCGVNANLAAQVANPQDLFQGRGDPSTINSIAGIKAIEMYREWPLTGVIEGQARRPLKTVETSPTRGE